MKLRLSSSARTFLLALFIYLVSIVVVAPWGNFAVNDDFYFFIQVRAFLQGMLVKSAFIDPSFILQGLLGSLWSFIFGLSFSSLRFLSILTSVVCLIGLYKILVLKKVQPTLIFISLLTISFNPLFYVSSLTFMTEIYFLVFVVWSLYFLLKYSDSVNFKHLLISALLGGLSIMVRQFGVVLFPIILLTHYFKNKQKVVFKETLCFSLAFWTLACIGIFWPKYTSPLEPQSLSPFGLLNLRYIFYKTLGNFSISSYIGFSLLPLTALLFLKLSKKLRALIVLATLFLAYFIYSRNVFEIGNLFYLEGVYAKSYISFRSSIFNNIPFKLLVAFISELSFLTLFVSCIVNGRKWVSGSANKIIVSSSILFFLIVGLTTNAYDRYYLNFLVFTVVALAFAVSDQKIKLRKISYVMLLFTALVVLLLSVDYFRDLKLKWNLADELAKNGVERSSIFINDSFIKYSNLLETNNYSGTIPAMSADPKFKCYVQNFSKQENNLFNTDLVKLENYVKSKKLLPQNSIDGAGYSKKFAGRCGKDCVIKYEKPYFSPVQSILGRQMYVRAFCIQ